MSQVARRRGAMVVPVPGVPVRETAQRFTE
jgi:hypothetical protein